MSFCATAEAALALGLGATLAYRLASAGLAAEAFALALLCAAACGALLGAASLAVLLVPAVMVLAGLAVGFSLSACVGLCFAALVGLVVLPGLAVAAACLSLWVLGWLVLILVWRNRARIIRNAKALGLDFDFVFAAAGFKKAAVAGHK